MTVVCPRCGEEREDEVTEAEERLAIANVSPPEVHCSPHHGTQDVRVDWAPASWPYDACINSQLHNLMLLDACCAPGLPAALVAAKSVGETEVFICGGGEVYTEALPLCDRIYLIVIEREYDGDTWFHFDHFARRCWKRIEVTHVEGTELPHRYEIWERVK